MKGDIIKNKVEVLTKRPGNDRLFVSYKARDGHIYPIYVDPSQIEEGADTMVLEDTGTRDAANRKRYAFVRFEKSCGL